MDEADIVAPRTGYAGLAPNVRGALWMLASAISFTAMTTMVKFLGDDYPAPLQAFYRNAAVFVILLPYILRHRSAAFATSRPGMMLFRSGAGTIGLILSFYAFQHMPLADANAMSFTRTLWVVPLAAIILHERMGPLRVGAAVVGFLGVLLMVRPGAGGHISLGIPALAMLTAAFVLSLTAIGMKSMTRDHGPMVLLVWSAVLGLVFTIPGAILAWRVPTLRDFILLCVMGAISIVNQSFYIKGMQIGDAGAMASIDYSRLVFSLVTGFFFFHELPNAWTMAGAAVVVGSTLFITLREQQLARRGGL